MADFRLCGDHVHQLLRDFLRVAVQYPDPAQPLYGSQRLQQPGQAFFPVEIHAVEGGLLGHENQFPDTALRQPFRLLQQRVHGNAPVVPPDLGYDAVGAALAAALRNLQIGEVPSCGHDPLPACGRRRLQAPIVIPCPAGEDFLHRLPDFLYGRRAHQRVHLGNLPADFLLVALSQAARGDQGLQLPLSAQIRHLQQRPYALLLGIPDEAAGIDNRDIRFLLVIGKGKTFFPQNAQHQLRVGQILVTAKRYQ